MGQVVFIFSPSTLGWEEAGLCEFQPSLVHIKFQARYTEGTGQQTDYGSGDRGILVSWGLLGCQGSCWDEVVPLGV